MLASASADTWPRKKPFVVHKFGGTSVGSVSAIRQVVDIVEEVIGSAAVAPSDITLDLAPAPAESPKSVEASRGRPYLAVVVSAMGGKPKVTDMLLDLVTHAAKGRCEEYAALLSGIEKKHMDTIIVSEQTRGGGAGGGCGAARARNAPPM